MNIDCCTPSLSTTSTTGRDRGLTTLAFVNHNSSGLEKSQGPTEVDWQKITELLPSIPACPDLAKAATDLHWEARRRFRESYNTGDWGLATRWLRLAMVHNLIRLTASNGQTVET